MGTAGVAKRWLTKIVRARTKPVGVRKPLRPDPPPLEAMTKRLYPKDGDE